MRRRAMHCLESWWNEHFLFRTSDGAFMRMEQVIPLLVMLKPRATVVAA
jgi:hypothetical protein